MIQVVLATAIGRVAQTGTALDVVDPDGSVLGAGIAKFRNSTNQLSYKLIHAESVTSGEDLFRIRKWASTEPSVSVGAE